MVSQTMLGKTEPVLIEGFTRDGKHLLGRTENNRVMNILIPQTDAAHPQADSWIGELRDAKVTEVLKHTLRGELT
jgi:tRNA A37 methylthiotransferase MiaB